MGKTLSEYDYHIINPKAVAMADRLNKALNTMYNFGEDADDNEIYHNNHVHPSNHPK